jgi:metal-responsive CopG/Arc/MetJ family transcriptional regulator
MRILTDIGDSQLAALDRLAKREKMSRAALIRHAVDDVLAKHRQENQSDAFGLWGDRTIDGLAYQEKLRAEW